MTEGTKWVAAMAHAGAMGTVADGPLEIAVVCFFVVVLIFALDRECGE